LNSYRQLSYTEIDFCSDYYSITLELEKKRIPQNPHQKELRHKKAPAVEAGKAD